jgi:putative protease
MAWLPVVAGLSRPVALGAGGLDGILIGNAGHIELLRGCGLPLYGDTTLNAFNGWSLKAYARLGLAGLALSQELTMAQIAALPDTGMDKEAAVYGRQPLMTSAHCPIGAELAGNEGGGRCGLCAGAHTYELIDRTGARFPVLCDAGGCRSTILNSDTLAVPALALRLAGAGVSMLRISIYDEPADDVKRILGLFRRALAGETTDGLKGRGYTKGHYFRGV